MKKITVPIKGMHCRSCEILIENNIQKINGVKKVEVDHKKGVANIFAEQVLSDSLIKKAIGDAGYSIGSEVDLSFFSKNKNDYKNLFKAFLLLLFLYFFVRFTGISNLGSSLSSEASLGAALLIGMVAGVSTCMALIGGLVLSVAARHVELHPEANVWQKFRPHLFFNLGRILGFFLLGGFIGFLGSALKLSNNLLALLTILVSLVMVFLGLKLLGIFPILENKSITLPKSIIRLFGGKTEVKEYSHRGAMFAGALTFFLPCGFTQAMQLFAVSTGSFWFGGLSMAIFAFGTSFGLLGIGVFSAAFRGQKAKIFFSTVGLLVIMLGLFNIANASNIISWGNKISNNVVSNIQNNEVQIVNMTQGSSGYSPNVLTVKKGIPVRWVINSTNSYTCASSIIMRKYGISKFLEKGENIIEFTPTETGEIPFSCSMGMYRGKFIVE